VKHEPARAAKLETSPNPTILSRTGLAQAFWLETEIRDRGAERLSGFGVVLIIEFLIFLLSLTRFADFRFTISPVCR
jgi:hypothetical protein